MISLYNLYPAATVITATAQGLSSGQGIELLEQIAKDTLPPGTGYEWTAMSYQEKEVGNQIYIIYGLSLLLVYLVLAGQYESWIAPADRHRFGAAGAARHRRRRCWRWASATTSTPRSASSCSSRCRARTRSSSSSSRASCASTRATTSSTAAVEAARSRFRPILMTSFAFILGVVPLVLANGAGANAQKSIGIAVLTGMLGSTLLTVAFVPSIFVVLQRLEEWRARRKAARQVKPAIRSRARARASAA